MEGSTSTLHSLWPTTPTQSCGGHGCCHHPSSPRPPESLLRKIYKSFDALTPAERRRRVGWRAEGEEQGGHSTQPKTRLILVGCALGAAIEATALRGGCLQLGDSLLFSRFLLLGGLGSILDLVHIDCELDGIDSCLGSQVVHACLQSFGPAVEVHGGQLGMSHVRHVDVQRLRLIDVDATVSSHVDDHALLDLPDRLVELLQVLRHLHVLNAAVVGDQLRSKVLSPQVASDQVTQQVLVDLDELAGQDSPDVQVLSVGFEGLVVAQDLSSAGSGHRGQQKRVAETVLSDLLLEDFPVPSAAGGLGTPQVELQLALASRGARVSLIVSLFLGQLAGSLASSEIDGFENVRVQLLGLLALEGEPHHEESVSQTLNAETNGSVPHVGVAGLREGVVVPVNDLVQVASDDLCHFVEALEVVLLTSLLDECWQGDRGQVAHSHLVLGSVLDDLSAQIGGVDGSQILLVGLPVGGILVAHERHTSLHLAVQDTGPQVLSLDGLHSSSFLLETSVHRFELLTPDIHQALLSLGVVGLVGTE
mmetsp:Transcript_43526/g.93229  ORF Transcript_43526/g.93229 Transcript_43526/m.93229 type:complete len:535 (+) Transcript_43526:75-1679(+)